MNPRVMAVALVAAATLWPAAARAQVKFEPAPPPPPPPVFVTGPTSVIQTLYKPVGKEDAPKTRRAASPNDLASIGVRLAEVMKDALKQSEAASTASAGKKPAAPSRAGAAHAASTPLVEFEAGKTGDTPGSAPAGRIRLRWSDRIELRWPGLDQADAPVAGDRIPLIWR